MLISPAENRSCCNISIVNDPVLEGEEVFTVHISSIERMVNILSPNATVIITDDESKLQRLKD